MNSHLNLYIADNQLYLAGIEPKTLHTKVLPQYEATPHDGVFEFLKDADINTVLYSECF